MMMWQKIAEKALAAEPEPAVEPVAQEPAYFAHPHGGPAMAKVYMDHFATALEKQSYTIPLYTHPTPEAVRKLVEAAQSLLDEQNGPPLVSRAKWWQEAVEELRAALAEIRAEQAKGE